MNPLFLYVNRWLAEPAVWGESDCCLSTLDWVGTVQGVDLAADVRLTYDDFHSAQRATRFFTDPLRICRGLMEERARLKRTSAPGRGDVALFKWPRADGRILPTAGICVMPGHIACRSEPGQDPGVVSAAPDCFIGAWEVGYVDP